LGTASRSAKSALYLTRGAIRTCNQHAISTPSGAVSCGSCGSLCLMRGGSVWGNRRAIIHVTHRFGAIKNRGGSVWGNQKPISRHQRTVQRSHQKSSEAIRGHQSPSAAINGHQRPSAAIRGHQQPSTAINGHQSTVQTEGGKHRAAALAAS
jgi:hypothetical protein